MRAYARTHMWIDVMVMKSDFVHSHEEIMIHSDETFRVSVIVLSDVHHEETMKSDFVHSCERRNDEIRFHQFGILTKK